MTTVQSPTVTYRMRAGATVRGDVVPIAERIEALKQSHASPENPEGFTTPGEVLDDARDPRSPLHAHFTWDETEAAQKYNLIEARRLITCYGSPLHAHFTWDETEAAQKYNLIEARRLITCYEVRIIERNRPPIVISPANVHIRKPGISTRFVSTAYAMSQEDTRTQVITDCQTLIATLQRRLASIQDVPSTVLDLLDRARRLLTHPPGKKRRG